MYVGISTRISTSDGARKWPFDINGLCIVKTYTPCNAIGGSVGDLHPSATDRRRILRSLTRNHLATICHIYWFFWGHPNMEDSTV